MSESVGGIIGGIFDLVGKHGTATSEHEAALENSDYYRESAVEEGVAALDREAVRRTQLREALGQQVTGVAKSGVTFTGSVVTALRESIERGEQDMLALKRQGDQQVTDFLRAAKGEVNRARNTRRNLFGQAGSASAKIYSNVQRSKQPTNRTTQRGTNDRITDTPYGTSEGE